MVVRSGAWALLVPLILIAACSPTSTPMPTATPTPTPTSVPTPSAVSIATADGDTIDGTLYGSSSQAVIFSNMDSNRPQGWDPIAPQLAARGYMVLTYSYSRLGASRIDDLRDALAFIRDQGAAEIILIGASRGGVVAIQLMIASDANTDIVAIATISAPQYYQGSAFYTDEELAGIALPKLLVNSEGDSWADDTRGMYEAYVEPKELRIFPGSGHGTDVFNDNRDDLVQCLLEFVEAGFAD
jgi:pimeloyl-ACP methyl ester carboxylesterase